MSRKTRKLIWSVPLIAAVTVIGVLAAFMTMAPGGLFADELSGAPQNLSVEAADGSAGRTTLVLTWEAPASGAPNMYRIDRSSDNDKWKYLTSVPGTQLTHPDDTVKGKFDTGTTMFYRVFAVDSGHGISMGYGSGRVSTSESGTTDPLTVPEQVTPFDWSSTDPEMINLTWTAPDDGGSPILGYCILAIGPGEVNAVGEDEDDDVDDDNCLDLFSSDGPGKGPANTTDANDGDDGDVIRIRPDTSYAHKGLRAKQEWNYTIYAVNEYGQSMTPSDTRNAETIAAKRPSAPGSLMAVQTDDTTRIINLYWTAAKDGGQDIEAYEVQVSAENRQWPSENFVRGAVPNKMATAGLTADPDDLDDFYAVFLVDEGGQTSELPYQLQHTYNVGTDFDGDGPAQVTFADKLYYQVRTVTGTGADEMKSTYISTSIDVEDPTDFMPPIGAPAVIADAGVVADDGEAGLLAMEMRTPTPTTPTTTPSPAR